jgi:hypothetical protein
MTRCMGCSGGSGSCCHRVRRLSEGEARAGMGWPRPTTVSEFCSPQPPLKPGALCRPMESISFVSIGRDLAMREGEEVANGMGGTRAVG